MARVERFDRGELRRKPYLTDEGFLFVEGVATRCGVFEYRQPDGTVIRELRDDADVLDPNSLATLGRKPVTLLHPEVNGERVLVTPENYQQFSAGTVGDRVLKAGGFVEVSMSIGRADAIDAINDGVQELSCGYECDVDPTPGVHPTYGRYDQRQTKITYNHIAVVPQGRAGDKARLRMDAAEQTTTPPQHEERHMAKIKIGDVEFEVSAELAPVLTALRADAADKMPKVDMFAPKLDMDGLMPKMDALSGKCDALMSQYDAMEAKVDSAEARMGELLKMLGEMAQDGEISESALEMMGEELRGDSVDMTPEAKAARDTAREAAKLAEFNRRAGLLGVAKSLRVDGVDTLPTAALEEKVALSYLKQTELRADQKSPAYLRSVCDIAIAQSDSLAHRAFGSRMTTGRADNVRTDAADDLADSKAKYEERLRNPQKS